MSRTWLLASAVLGRTVSTDEPYPHVHQKVGRQACAACGAGGGGEDSVSYRGGGGHECRPADQATGDEPWTCPDCTAGWRVTEAVRSGIRTRTWGRA